MFEPQAGEDASRGPSIPPLTTSYSKMLIFLVFDESVTDGPTDGRTDGRTDRPGYRDARTFVFSVFSLKLKQLKGKSLSAQLCKNMVSYLILKKEMTAVAARKLTVFEH